MITHIARLAVSHLIQAHGGNLLFRSLAVGVASPAWRRPRIANPRPSGSPVCTASPMVQFRGSKRELFPRILVIWLTLSLTLTAARATRAALTLDPICSDNMVLQEGTVNWLRGRATPGAKVWATFKTTKSSPVKAGPDGIWKLDLDLSKLPDPSPDKLRLTEKPRKGAEIFLDLNNVAVGKVWWLGVHGRGLVVNPRTLTNVLSSDRIRVLNLVNFPAANAWVSLRQLGETAQHLNVFSLEAATYLMRKDGYFGIVQTTPEVIGTLGPEPSVNARPSVQRTKIATWFGDVEARLNRDQVAPKEREYQQILISAKHEGDIAHIVFPSRYAFSKVRLREDFPPTKELPTVYWPYANFEGAIW